MERYVRNSGVRVWRHIGRERVMAENRELGSLSQLLRRQETWPQSHSRRESQPAWMKGFRRS